MSRAILLSLNKARDNLLLEGQNTYNYIEINSVSIRFKSDTPTFKDRIYLKIPEATILSNTYKNGIPLYYTQQLLSTWVPNLKIKLTGKLSDVIYTFLVNENNEPISFAEIEDIEILMSFIV